MTRLHDHVIRDWLTTISSYVPPGRKKGGIGRKKNSCGPSKENTTLLCRVIHRGRVVSEDLAKVPRVHTLPLLHWPCERVKSERCVRMRCQQRASPLRTGPCPVHIASDPRLPRRSPTVREGQKASLEHVEGNTEMVRGRKSCAHATSDAVSLCDRLTVATDPKWQPPLLVGTELTDRHGHWSVE